MNDPKKDRWINPLPFLADIYQEEIEIDRPFEEAAACFAADRGTVLLQSGGDLDCSGYHILAVNPWLEITSGENGIRIDCQGRQWTVEQDIFSLLEQLTQHYRWPADKAQLPVQCGLFGYLSYDLKDRIETLPCTCMDTGLPDLYLAAPSAILIHDKTPRKTHLSIPVFAPNRDATPLTGEAAGIKEFVFAKMDSRFKPGSFSVQGADLTSSFTKEDYIDAVNRIIRYLKAGDIYQANLSQRFETGFSGDPFALFLDLFKRNPAAFFAYVNAGDHVIVSTSPERFVKRSQSMVETRPIKGTIARGKTAAQDIENREQLAASLKDDAELTMIVDLMRNDISRVTEHGSVVVTEHKRLEPYENVYHLVSIVQGRMLPDKSSIDLIRATFPGGSITGCPKIRAMEIIDELEPVKRHVYTGSIGYISFHDTMDLSIAIRTATIYNDKVFFSVGGGIVYDSDPEKEYQETLDKGKTLIESLSGQKQAVAAKKEIVWLNGRLTAKDRAAVPLASPGFLYGAGVFETLRSDSGRIFFLKEHIGRMRYAWKTIFRGRLPKIDWGSVIEQVIRKNGLDNSIAAVKIIVAKADASFGGQTVAVMAEPYTHRLEKVQKPGLDLVTFEHARHSYLADYKTLNYLFCDRVGDYAKQAKADEAVILNCDETVSETNTANLIAIKGRQVIVPQSPHMLYGVTLGKVLEILAEQAYDIKKEPVPYQLLLTYPNIILTNSLMGAVMVMSIDGRQIKQDQTVCSMINKKLFG